MSIGNRAREQMRRKAQEKVKGSENKHDGLFQKSTKTRVLGGSLTAFLVDVSSYFGFIILLGVGWLAYTFWSHYRPNLITGRRRFMLLSYLKEKQLFRYYDPFVKLRHSENLVVDSESNSGKQLDKIRQIYAELLEILDVNLQADIIYYKSDEIDAFVTTNGTLYLTTAAVESLDDEDETLAALLSKSISHAYLRHPCQHLTRELSNIELNSVKNLFQKKYDPAVEDVLYQSRFTIQEEIEADFVAKEILKRSKYRIESYTTLIDKLYPVPKAQDLSDDNTKGKALSKKEKPKSGYTFLHPMTAKRRKALVTANTAE